VVYEV